MIVIAELLMDLRLLTLEESLPSANVRVVDCQISLEAQLMNVCLLLNLLSTFHTKADFGSEKK
jgi:hypothetical protein